MFAPFVQFKNAVVERDERAILDIPELTLKLNEHVAILGPNGSGKSTLLKILNSEIHPLFRREPPIKIFGKDTWTRAEVHTRVSFISQELQSKYLLDCTALTTIVSGFFDTIDLWEAASPAQYEKARNIAAKFHVGHLLERTMETLSQGEARRMLICRAIVNDPEILIFDEPTNGLDLVAQAEFVEFMDLLCKDHTVILVTHAITEISPSIERVILLQDGKVFADGSKASVLTDAQMSGLFGRAITVKKSGAYYSAHCE